METAAMKIKFLAIPLLVLFLGRAAFQTLSARAEPAPQPAQEIAEAGGFGVTLRAGSGAAIEFKTQNGQTRDGFQPETRTVPHLVLHRNGALTPAAERTLIVQVDGLPVPPAGLTVTLQLETQHGDPDLGGGPDRRITVWRESRWVPGDGDSSAAVTSLQFHHQFDDTLTAAGEAPMPTDYYRVEIALWDEAHPPAEPRLAYRDDFAFLLENQMLAPLPQVQEESPGSAPDELVVYYCDMFPFRQRIGDSATWLQRDEVGDHLQAELVPAMTEAFRVQTDDWGFPWSPAWTGYRTGEDSRRLSVALSDGETWFHGRAPDRGHAGISITTDDSAHYDTLTDAIMSNFHHELFHNLQRNLYLDLGGDGDISGVGEAWAFFSEGTAVLASSVGQPEVQFAQTRIPRAYLSYARLFPTSESYEEMDPYRAALYWRFLYEQCGGMSEGVENPAAGMGIIRNALTVLYSGEAVDVSASTDLVAYLPAIMDRALARTPSCPFRSHAESLVGFARALYALRLDGGRCAAPGVPSGCGFYDPDHIYRDPLVGSVTYTGAGLTFDRSSQPYPAGIQSSFGIDFLDVVLDPAAAGSLTVELRGAPGAAARFHVQLWGLAAGENLSPQGDPVSLVGASEEDGRLVYTLPALELDQVDRLGLIITRLDAQESTDPAGDYTLILSPAPL
jgi:hypothetical protein